MGQTNEKIVQVLVIPMEFNFAVGCKSIEIVMYARKTDLLKSLDSGFGVFFKTTVGVLLYLHRKWFTTKGNPVTPIAIGEVRSCTRSCKPFMLTATLATVPSRKLSGGAGRPPPIGVSQKTCYFQKCFRE
jgi:hypothetical protein